MAKTKGKGSRWRMMSIVTKIIQIAKQYGEIEQNIKVPYKNILDCLFTKKEVGRSDL